MRAETPIRFRLLVTRAQMGPFSPDPLALILRQCLLPVLEGEPLVEHRDGRVKEVWQCALGQQQCLQLRLKGSLLELGNRDGQVYLGLPVMALLVFIPYLKSVMEDCQLEQVEGERRAVVLLRWEPGERFKLSPGLELERVA